MASQQELHAVMARAAASPTFRQSLTANADAATKGMGVTLDAQQLAAFQGAASKIKASNLDLKISDKVASLLAVWI